MSAQLFASPYCSPASSEPNSPHTHSAGAAQQVPFAAVSSSSHDEELFQNLVMQLDMASAEAQLATMCLQQGNRRNSLGGVSTCSSTSSMSNDEFESFLLSVLQEELAAQATSQQ